MEIKDGGIMGKMFAKALQSDKLLEFVSDMGVGDMIGEIFKIPALKEKIMGELTQLSEEMRGHFEIKKWEYVVDRRSNVFCLNLYIEEEGLRRKFKAKFKGFLEDLQLKFGGAFDSFIALYQIQEISCIVIESGVSIRVATPKVDDLEKILLELSTAGVEYEGGDE